MSLRALLFLILLVSFLEGCVATSTPVFTPDGNQGFAIDCSSSELTWGDCYTKAGEVCGAKGYNIIDKVSDQTSSAIASQNSAYASEDINRTMIISCKE